MSDQPGFFNGSSQTQQPKHQTNSLSVENVEQSVQYLIKSWCRRQKWKQFCDPGEQEYFCRAPWRNHLVKFLESTPVHVFVISLLLLDLILTILELSSSLLSCKQVENKIENVWYHWVGIGILALLSAKSVALAIGLGSSFFKRPGYVVDGAVAMGALVLEAFLRQKGGGLLVVASLWRVVRVVESAFELSDEAIEAQVKGIVGQFEALIEENRRLLKTITEKDNAIEKLHEMIEKLEEELDQCTGLLRTNIRPCLDE